MTTYRITAPDGAVYNVTPPEGTNPSEADILAQVQAQHGGASAPGNAITRSYKAMAAPVTQAVSRLADAATEPLVGVARRAMGEPAEQVAKSYETPEGRRDMEARSKMLTNPIAEFVVPQTPIEAGATAGTLVLPWATPIRAASPTLARVLRIGGGAVGGAVGAAISDENVGKGIAVGGGGALAGEIGSAATSKLARSLPWMKGAIAQQDARRFGNAVGEVSEPLAGATTGAELHGLGAGEGRAALRADRAARVADIDAMIGGQTIDVPSLGGPLRLGDAMEALSNVGVRLSQHPADRTVRQLPDVRTYDTVINEIRAGLNAADQSGRAAAAFDSAQDVYRGGITIVKRVLAKEGLLTADGQFNTPLIQKALATQRTADLLRTKLGEEGYRMLETAAFRGGAATGPRDRLVSGGGGPLDAFKQWTRGNNTGFTQLFGVPLRTVLPNIGSQYAGRPPLTIPDFLQALIDVNLQQHGAALGEQR